MQPFVRKRPAVEGLQLTRLNAKLDAVITPRVYAFVRAHKTTTGVLLEQAVTRFAHCVREGFVTRLTVEEYIHMSREGLKPTTISIDEQKFRMLDAIHQAYMARSSYARRSTSRNQFLNAILKWHLTTPITPETTPPDTELFELVDALPEAKPLPRLEFKE